MNSFIKHLFHRNADSGEDDMHPSRDWVRLLDVCTLFLGISVALSLFVYWQIRHGETSGKGVTTPQSIDIVTLQKAQTLFDTRAAEEAKYASSTYTFIDPSQE